ncbi:MAG: hypothetical protein RLZ72_1259 [Actinomycetota bacterium]|jgi:RNA polymerase sigma-70 factor (ECF subfamily)
MIREHEEKTISEHNNVEEGNDFDFLGHDPEIQAGMEANATAIQIPSAAGWNPAEITTDYRNTGIFDEVFPPLLDRVYNHASYELNRLGMNRELLEEVMQIASLKARDNWDKYTQGTYALAWLKKIVTNTCFNLRRQRRTLDFREQSIGDTVEFFDSRGYESASAERQAIDNLRAAEIIAMFDKLPPNLRAAATAVILDQMTTLEAAALLGIPSATVLTRVHRARARLRGMLGGERGTEKDI